MLIAPKESKAHMLILSELLQRVLGAVGGLRATKVRGASSYTSVALGGRWVHER